jgi:hypothetical protein
MEISICRRSYVFNYLLSLTLTLALLFSGGGLFKWNKERFEESMKIDSPPGNVGV